MEEIIDELRSRNEPVPVALELPEFADLVLVEEQLLISLDRDFRDFLLNVSDVVYGSLEPVTVMDSGSHTYLPELAAMAWDQGLPRNLIPLCEDGNKLYCVNEDGEVGLWENAALTEDSWENVWYWVQDVWLAR